MPLNRNYNKRDIRRLLTELEEFTEHGTSREVSDLCQLGDREIRHLRKGERNAIPATYRCLQLSLWVQKAWRYLEEGEAVPDQLFWELETIIKSGH